MGRRDTSLGRKVTAFGWERIVEDREANLASRLIYQELAHEACQSDTSVGLLNFSGALARATARLKAESDVATAVGPVVSES